MQKLITPPQEDTRKHFYTMNYEWALKMTFRYLGKYDLAVTTVHDTFLGLFRVMGQEITIAKANDHLCEGIWLKAFFIKAAVNAALQRAAQDTAPVRTCGMQTYLRELDRWDGAGADPSEYRTAVAQLILLPLYQRLAYNICIIEGRPVKEAAELLGIKESRAARHVEKARTQLKKTMTRSHP